MQYRQTYYKSITRIINKKRLQLGLCALQSLAKIMKFKDGTDLKISKFLSFSISISSLYVFQLDYLRFIRLPVLIL